MLCILCALCSGNLILKDIVLTSPELGALTCPASNQADPSSLGYTCTATYTVNATDLERGQLTFTAKGTSSTLSAEVAAAQPVVLTMEALPQLHQDLEAGSCNQTGGSGNSSTVTLANSDRPGMKNSFWNDPQSCCLFWNNLWALNVSYKFLCCAAGAGTVKQLTCRVKLQNTGNVRLGTFNKDSQLQGCDLTVLKPQQAVYCTVTRSGK